MILTGQEIEREVGRGFITITPFSPKFCNPNSYNFHLGKVIKTYRDKILDPRKANKVEEVEIPKEGLLLSSEKIYLGHISERIGSNYFVPIMKGISSIGRLGLFINITADLIDQGAIGNWTLQLHAVQPVRIFPGMPIGQMTFWVVDGKPMLYSGKYQGATGPMESLSHKDPFFKK